MEIGPIPMSMIDDTKESAHQVETSWGLASMASYKSVPLKRSARGCLTAQKTGTVSLQGMKYIRLFGKR